VDPVQNTDRDRFPAHRAAAVAGLRLLRVETDSTLPMAVRVVLPLLGKELHCPADPGARLQRPLHGEVVRVAVEDRALPSELCRGMRVRVGDEG